MVLCVNAENVLYFDSFEVEYIPKEILNFKGNKSIIKYLQNTSIRFNNVWILLYWIY